MMKKYETQQNKAEGSLSDADIIGTLKSGCRFV